MNRKNYSEQAGANALNMQLTPDGRDWIVAALDPFHDFQRQLAGYPDTDSCMTTVACYNSEIDVAAPAGAAGNWDAHVFTMPFTTHHTLHEIESTNADFTFKQSTGAAIDLAALTVVKVDAGQPLFPTPLAHYNPTHLAIDTINAAASAGQGQSRVIAWGFEIVNTTAELNKQGALTAYRMPQMSSEDESILPEHGAAITVMDKVRAKRFRSPPATPAQAVLLGGTRQWAAADGAYVVVPQSTIANPMSSATNIVQIVSATTPAVTGHYVYMSDIINDYTTAVPNMSPFIGTTQKFLPFNTCGVMLTGLSLSSTFRIKMKMYVERAPTFIEPDISVLATASAAYDSRVLEIYSRALSQLPIAVPVSMNGFGDWFRTVLNIVGTVAMPIGAALGGPPGAVVGGLVSTAAKGLSMIGLKSETKQAVKRMNDEQKAKKKGPQVATVRKYQKGARQSAITAK